MTTSRVTSEHLARTSKLVQAAQQGDRPALDQLVGRHHGRLLALVRLTMSADLAIRVLAEDVVQETYVEALRKIATYDLERGTSFYSWLAGIAKFKLAEARRSAGAAKRARERTLTRSRPSDQTSLVSRVASQEVFESVRAAMDAIPADQARAVKLRYLEGRSLKETARELERSESAVKALVARGLCAMGRAVKNRT